MSVCVPLTSHILVFLSLASCDYIEKQYTISLLITLCNIVQGGTSVNLEQLCMPLCTASWLHVL